MRCDLAVMMSMGSQALAGLYFLDNTSGMIDLGIAGMQPAYSEKLDPSGRTS